MEGLEAVRYHIKWYIVLFLQHHLYFLDLVIQCHLSIVSFSSLKLLCQMEPNLAENIYVRSFIKLVHFVLIGQQTWQSWAILNSDWLSFQKSPPKPLGQMELNLAGSTYGRSFIKFNKKEGIWCINS